MLFSALFNRHRTPPPRFAPGLFLILLVVFVVIGQTRPVIALAGLGTTLLISGALVELNRNRIWDEYVAHYRKRRGPKSIWSKPNRVYYNINVAFLWPFIMFLGVACLIASYSLS